MLNLKCRGRATYGGCVQDLDHESMKRNSETRPLVVIDICMLAKDQVLEIRGAETVISMTDYWSISWCGSWSDSFVLDVVATWLGC